MKHPSTEPKEFLQSSFALLKQEYWRVWRGRAFPDLRQVHDGLSRYYDLNIWHDAAEAESGWDMTPRFDNRCLDFLAVDLNALLYRYETDFVQFSRILGAREEEVWLRRSERRKKRMYSAFWNQDKGFFFDYDYIRAEQSSFYSLAGFFPMWAGLIDQRTAQTMVDMALPMFEQDFGIVTTEEWHPALGETSKQWAWPNGWAPLHWIVISGLWRYGFEDEALRIALKWVTLVNEVFLQSGSNFEKYNVVNGARAVSDRYPDQEGFGWTNGIFLALISLLEKRQLPPAAHGLNF